MSIIDRYLTGEILKLFLPMLALLVLVFVGFSASVQLKQAVAGSITAAAAPRLIALNTLVALEILLPTTLFFGCIAALGRMQGDSEILVMRASGITLWHITMTVLRLGLLAALCAALLSIYARPWAYKLTYQLESEAVAKLDVSAMQPRQFVQLSNSGYTLYAGKVNREQGFLEDVFLQRRATASEPLDTLITAQRARLLPLDISVLPKLQFRDGHAYRLDPDGQGDVVLTFQRLKVELPEEKRLTEFRRNAVATLNLRTSDRIKDIAEYQWRLATPLLSLVLAALAVPLTMTRPRQTQGRALVLALVTYALIFGMTSIIRTGVEQSVLPIQPGMWLAPMFAGLLWLSLLLAPRLHWRNRIKA